MTPMKSRTSPRRNALRVLAFAAALPLAAGAADIKIDGYAAVVNDRVITIGEVLSLAQPVLAQLETAYEGDELREEIDKAVQMQLDALVQRALILEEFKAQEGQVPDRLIDDQVNVFISDRFDNDRAAFLEALAEDRLTLSDWREETKNRLVVGIMRRKEVGDRVVVSPTAVHARYEADLDKYRRPEQVRLRVIVLQQGATAEDREVKSREAGQIHERLLAGEDFSEMAKEVSEGNRASQGGDLGWLEPSSLKPELAEAVAGLETGAISDVVDAGDEFFILKVEGRKSASVVPFEEVRETIRDAIRQEEEQRLYDAWITRLKNKFYVKTFPIDLEL